jgi:hypothetical protein
MSLSPASLQPAKTQEVRRTNPFEPRTVDALKAQWRLVARTDDERKCRDANATPEPDLTYRSKATARRSSPNSMTTTNRRRRPRDDRIWLSATPPARLLGRIVRPNWSTLIVWHRDGHDGVCAELGSVRASHRDRIDPSRAETVSIGPQADAEITAQNPI